MGHRGLAPRGVLPPAPGAPVGGAAYSAAPGTRQQQQLQACVPGAPAPVP